jgi:CRISPR-associated endonuclease/helicase Cas3
VSRTPFDEFFATATGCGPLDYQRQLAAGGLPESLTVPTGPGRTGVILAWLWRRLHATGQVRESTPRRLFYVLPRIGLTEPAAAEVAGWLTRLGLDERVGLMPSGNGLRQWRRDMHGPAIVIGTADVLVSKALNRGYGVGRIIYPIDFALATNGAQWVFDEVSLCPSSAATMSRIGSAAASLGTAEPFGVTFLASAQVPDGPVAARLGTEPGDYPAIAAAAAELHRPGRRTLIVLSSVVAAQRVHAELAGGPVDCVLVHAEFRGRERRVLAETALASQDRGQIVVATAVVDAGLAITAELVVTEGTAGLPLGEQTQAVGSAGDSTGTPRRAGGRGGGPPPPPPGGAV